MKEVRIFDFLQSKFNPEFNPGGHFGTVFGPILPLWRGSITPI